MKSFLRILFFLLLASQICSAQWVQCGPSGGFISDIKVSGNKVFAATYGGVLVSTNSGIDWSHSNWGLLDGDVRSVAVTGSKVFAGTYDSGVYVKDINGSIWEQTSFKDQSVISLTSVGDNVLAGTYSTGIYLTTDNGKTWKKVNNGLNDFQVNCFAVSGTKIFAGAGDKVYLSTDMGNNWATVSNGLPENTIISLAVNGPNIYAGIWANGIYMSPNDGLGWMKLGTSSPCGYVQSIAFNGSTMYAVGGKVYCSTNEGDNWTNISNDISSRANIQSIAYCSGNLIAGDNAVNTSTGMYVSSDGGGKWTWINWGLPNYCANAITANNGKVIAATGGGLFNSTNSGQDWRSPSLHGDREWSDFSTVAYRGSNYVFAGDVNGYVWVGSDAGQSLTLKSQIEKGVSVTSFAFISTFVFAATKPFEAGKAGGVYLSYDNGATWKSVSTGLPSLADTNTYVTSLAVIGNNLFAGTGHGVYLSTDYGTSWSKVNNGLTGSWVYSLAVKGNELFAGTFGQGVFRSTDNGTTWTHTSLVKDVTSLFVADTTLFAGTWSQGVYRYVNSDQSWKSVGLPNVYITGFAADNGTLYASTLNNTVWRRPISELTGINEMESKIPYEFSLSQNYPNPFNPITTISYSVADPSHVELKVYDMLGREVSTLVSKYQSRGEYKIQFDAASLPSGIYIYSIKAGQFRDSKKLVLLK